MQEILELQRKLKQVQQAKETKLLSERMSIQIYQYLQQEGELEMVSSMDGQYFYTKYQLDQELNELCQNYQVITIPELESLSNISQFVISQRVPFLVQKFSLTYQNNQIITKEYLNYFLAQVQMNLDQNMMIDLYEVLNEFRLDIQLINEILNQRLQRFIKLGQGTQLVSTRLVENIKRRVRAIQASSFYPVNSVDIKQSIKKLYPKVANLDQLLNELVDSNKFEPQSYVEECKKQLLQQVEERIIVSKQQLKKSTGLSNIDSIIGQISSSDLIVGPNVIVNKRNLGKFINQNEAELFSFINLQKIDLANQEQENIQQFIQNIDQEFIINFVSQLGIVIFKQKLIEQIQLEILEGKNEREIAKFLMEHQQTNETSLYNHIINLIEEQKEKIQENFSEIQEEICSLNSIPIEQIDKSFYQLAYFNVQVYNQCKQTYDKLTDDQSKDELVKFLIEEFIDFRNYLFLVLYKKFGSEQALIKKYNFDKNLGFDLNQQLKIEKEEYDKLFEKLPKDIQQQIKPYFKELQDIQLDDLSQFIQFLEKDMNSVSLMNLNQNLNKKQIRVIQTDLTKNFKNRVKNQIWCKDYQKLINCYLQQTFYNKQIFLSNKNKISIFQQLTIFQNNPQIKDQIEQNNLDQIITQTQEIKDIKGVRQYLIRKESNQTQIIFKELIFNNIFNNSLSQYNFASTDLLDHHCNFIIIFHIQIFWSALAINLLSIIYKVSLFRLEIASLTILINQFTQTHIPCNLEMDFLLILSFNSKCNCIALVRIIIPQFPTHNYY